MNPTPSHDGRRLVDITTRWDQINDPSRFVLRYAPAIRKYLDALLPDANDADEVLQRFLLQVTMRGFANANPERGSFRRYLTVAVHNAARQYLRDESARRRRETHMPEDIADGKADDVMTQTWRTCVLDLAWQRLEQHERKSEGNHAYTVLRCVSDHEGEDATTQARRVSATIGRELTAVTYRKQLSRARRIFARLLLEEVTATLDHPTPVQVEEEMGELGLLSLIAEYLPADWRRSGSLPEME